MRLVIPIEKSEKTILCLERNWFVGSFTFSINNGPTQMLRSALDPTTHLDLSGQCQYTIELADPDQTKILVKHSWPTLFAGFRPHAFEVYVDEILVRSYQGF